jgi:hypothetical protein
MEKYIKEIKDIKINIDVLEKVLNGALNESSTTAMQNWMNTKPNCGFYSPKVVRDLCEKPGLLNKNILNPVRDWLNEYSLNLEKNVPGFNLESLLRRGITVIYNFTQVALFFSKNSQYFDFDKNRTNKQKDKVKIFILDLIGELSNCSSKLNIIYDRLNKLKVVPELAKMRQDIDFMCYQIRRQKLDIDD